MVSSERFGGIGDMESRTYDMSEWVFSVNGFELRPYTGTMKVIQKEGENHLKVLRRERKNLIRRARKMRRVTLIAI